MSTPKTTAAKAAATDSPILVSFDGEVYKIPPTEAWDLDVLEAFEDGKVATMIRGLVGADDWTRFRSKPRTVGDLSDFADKISVAVNAGN